MTEIKETSINDIRPYENNPRFNEASVDKVANSIKEFGFRNPIIVDRDGVIIAGHTRYKAAQRLGLQTVPVIIAEDLTPEQVRAYRIADNKAGEGSLWDYDLLNIELESIKTIDMDLFGSWGPADYEAEPMKPTSADRDSEEIDLEEFSKFQCECPRCHFKFNPKVGQ